MMNKELLIEKYPWLKLKDEDPQHTWIDLMPKGWFVAFGEFFFEDLDHALMESYPEGIPEDFHITDIKEKWGTLRVYMTHHPEAVRDVVFTYEYLSSFVCIVCGAPYPFAQMTYDGWIMPMCEKCYIGDSINEFEKYHNMYLQTVLKDCLTVAEGPKDFITIESFDGENEVDRKIDVKRVWEKIFQAYVERTIV